MRYMLPKSILAAVVLTAAALCTHPANAETLLKVPFDFTVAGHLMPAGLYVVRADSDRNLVTLQSKDATHSYSCTLTPGNPAPDASRIALNFKTEGGMHVLSSIQYGPKVTSRLDKVPSPSYDPARLSMGR